METILSAVLWLEQQRGKFLVQNGYWIWNYSVRCKLDLEIRFRTDGPMNTTTGFS